MTIVEFEGDLLSALVGVPVVGGWNDNKNGYTRYDFKQPLEEHEIKKIESVFGMRLYSVFNEQQVFIMHGSR